MCLRCSGFIPRTILPLREGSAIQLSKIGAGYSARPGSSGTTRSRSAARCACFRCNRHRSEHNPLPRRPRSHRHTRGTCPKKAESASVTALLASSRAYPSPAPLTPGRRRPGNEAGVAGRLCQSARRHTRGLRAAGWLGQSPSPCRLPPAESMHGFWLDFARWFAHGSGPVDFVPGFVHSSLHRHLAGSQMPPPFRLTWH